jgi:hypothetical protein
VIEHSINQGSWIHFKDSLALAKVSTAAIDPSGKPQKLSYARISIEKVPTSGDVLVNGRHGAKDVAIPTV